MATDATITNPDYNRAVSVYEFSVKNIRGEIVKLDEHKGHVCLLVNIASKSTMAKESYKLLNELHAKFSESKGLRILAFPCDQFGNEEFPTSEETAAFAAENGVQFDLFDKIEVNGENASPLWKYLKHVVGRGGKKGSVVTANFTKFVTNKRGEPQERFGPELEPEKLVSSIEMYL